jgi:mandelate racemase
MALPHIKSITLSCVVVPLNPPHKTASGVVSKSPLVLIDLHCSGGLFGRSIVFTYTPIALKPVADLVLGIQEMIVGKSLEPVSLYDFLHRRMRLIGSQGLIGMALAGIDMALWDALARHRETPLFNLIGGTVNPVRAYGGIGYDGEIESANQAEQWVKRGFSGVKAKVGYPSVEEDLAVVRAMRKAVGPDVELMVDYNQSLSLVDALNRARHLDQERLLWIEEPVLAHDYQNTAKIAAAARTPIQSGENWWGPADMQLALTAQASDFVMPDVMKIGGVTGWQKAVALAEVQGIQVSSHLWPELSAQLLAAGLTAHRLEYVDWWSDILKQPLQVENGCAILDEHRPGSGIDWHLDKVEQYRV